MNPASPLERPGIELKVMLAPVVEEHFHRLLSMICS
jgi:hypothetical protein